MEQNCWKQVSNQSEEKAVQCYVEKRIKKIKAASIVS